VNARRRAASAPLLRRKPLPGALAALLSHLLPLGEAKARPMFGGHGVYLDGQFFAIAAGERIFFKVDEQTRARYQAMGMEVFRPFDDHTALTSYFEVPPAVLSDGEAVRDWAAEARAVALRAAQRRGPRRARRTRP